MTEKTNKELFEEIADKGPKGIDEFTDEEMKIIRKELKRRFIKNSLIGVGTAVGLYAIYKLVCAKLDGDDEVIEGEFEVED